MKNNESEQLYGLVDIAEILGVSRRTAGYYISERQIQTKVVQVYPQIGSLPKEVVVATKQALKDFIRYRQETAKSNTKTRVRIGQEQLALLERKDTRIEPEHS